MSTDLENELREALHARAAAITRTDLRYATGPRSPARPPRRHRRPATPWALAAALIVVAIVGVGVAVQLSSKSVKHAPSGATAPLLAGKGYRIVAVIENGHRQPITSSEVSVTFHFDHRFQGSDAVNFYGGQWRQSGGELVITDATSTLAGYAGHDAAVLAAQDALTAVTSGRPVTVEQAGDVVHLDTGDLTMDLAPMLDPGFTGADPSGAVSSTPSPTGHPSHSYVNGSELAPPPSGS